MAQLGTLEGWQEALVMLKCGEMEEPLGLALLCVDEVEVLGCAVSCWQWWARNHLRSLPIQGSSFKRHIPVTSLLPVTTIKSDPPIGQV